MKNFFKKLKKKVEPRLGFGIIQDVYPISKEDLEEKGTFYAEVTDKRVVIDLQTKEKGFLWMWILMSIAIFFFVFLSLKASFEYATSSPSIYIYICILPLFILALLYALYAPKKLVILDRETGLFTFPTILINLHPETFPFNKAIAFWNITPSHFVMLGIKNSENNRTSMLLSGCQGSDHSKMWSFFVWYMDKNRPLPPGTAFDPYRQADYERRKAEGFPPHFIPAI